MLFGQEIAISMQGQEAVIQRLQHKCYRSLSYIANTTKQSHIAYSTLLLCNFPLDVDLTLHITLYVTGFAKRYLSHTQNLTHFLNFEVS